MWYGSDMASEVHQASAFLERGRPVADPPPERLRAADGSPRLSHVAYDDDGYPFADGAPMTQNTRQADELFYAFPALRAWLRARFPDAFAASDLLIYPKRANLRASVAPDVFVAFGAGDRPRNSYKLFEGEPVPAFVLEVLSGTTADNDLGVKRDKYAAMGIEEYWIFDPFGRRIPGRVAGHRLAGGRYRAIRPAPGGRARRSRVLGLEFRAENGRLRIRDPATGEDLRGLDEEQAGRLAAEAEVARLKALLEAQPRRDRVADEG